MKLLSNRSADFFQPNDVFVGVGRGLMFLPEGLVCRTVPGGPLINVTVHLEWCFQFPNAIPLIRMGHPQTYTSMESL